MTALNFLVEPQRVLIAMDTLSVDYETKRPHLFCSKMFLLPHLGGVMCGTGAFPIIMDWFVAIQSQMLVKDMVHLDQFTPSLLGSIAAKHSLPDGVTATVYHFGYSKDAGEYAAFAYRSTSAFVSEPLGHGLGIKPRIEAEPFSQLPEGFIRLVHRQRDQDRAAPIAEQVGIGGEIQFLVMTPGIFQLSNCHRYENYEAQYAEMLRNVTRASED